VLASVAVALTSLPGLRYLADGGGRDAEAEAIAILRRRAEPGDGVLYDTGFQDPFRRRPAAFPAFPKEVARAPGGEAALDAAGVRWIVRSSVEPESPLDGPAFRGRLRGVGAVHVPRWFQEPHVLEVARILPR
jgi:hypothetical protein